MRERRLLLFFKLGGFMAKAKNSKFVGQNEDGSYFCGKCGQSGFANKQKVWGHLGQCRGYNKIISEVKKDQVILSESLANLQAQGTSKGLDVGYLPTYLAPTSEVPQEVPRSPLKTGSFADTEKLMRQNFILKTQNAELQKIAFNHNAHVMNVPNRSFSGPQDMVAQSFGTLFKYPIVQFLAGLTALAILVNFCKKHLGEAFGEEPRKKKSK